MNPHQVEEKHSLCKFRDFISAYTFRVGYRLILIEMKTITHILAFQISP